MSGLRAGQRHRRRSGWPGPWPLASTRLPGPRWSSWAGLDVAASRHPRSCPAVRVELERTLTGTSADTW